MIVRQGDKYIVKSESGKNLSKPLYSRKAAEKRLAQVHYFSRKDGKK